MKTIRHSPPLPLGKAFARLAAAGFSFTPPTLRGAGIAVCAAAFLLSACGGGGGGGGGGSSGLLPESPYAYRDRGCGGAENGVVYQRLLAGEGFNTTDTYAISASDGTNYYARATSNGSLRAVNAPTGSGGEILGTLIGLLLPFPLPIPSGPTPTPIPAVGHAFVLGNGITLSDGSPAVVRVFEQNGQMYFAVNTGNSCSPGSHNLAASVFAFPAGRFAVPRNRTVFALRDAFRGFMSGKGAAVGDFRFLAGDDFHLLHFEHQATLLELDDGAFSLLADTGYKRWDDGMHSAVYGKLTAERQWSENADIYLQAMTGDLESDFYADSILQGFAAGVFAEKIIRGDDFWHLRAEQPFSSPEAAEWQLAADLRIGKPEKYYGIGATQSLNGKGAELLLFYRREF